MLRRSLILCIVALGVALAGSAAPAAAQCITGPEVSCEPAELCAPEGWGAYYWAPPNGGVQTTRCILATESGTYTVRFGETPETLGEPCFFKFHIECGPKCEITGKLEVCRGEKTELCGPEGDCTYLWSGPGDFSATSRCIVVGPGLYKLELTCGESKSECVAEVVEKKEGCTFNCPRTIGFWSQQCAQKNDGSAKFTPGEVSDIASCVDGKVAIFNWGAGSFTGFCSTISPLITNQRTQAKRQFAAFLANLCTDELNLIADNGDEILLDPSTPVTCGGVTTTIGALVGAVDAQLLALEGESLSKGATKSAYSEIINCLDAINNGVGIGPTCLRTSVLTIGAASGSRSELEARGGSLELASPYPNPSTGMVRMDYAIQGSGSIVKIAVYDLAGRKVRELVSGFHGAGTYRAEWNARDANGGRVRSGVYFIRGSIGSQVTTRQVIVH